MNVEWLKDAIIYQIMVDRFSTSNSQLDKSLAGKTSNEWMGGNLKGIIKHFTHIKKLGVNTIYLSPIYQTSSYHGYHVIDFFKIDPHFGKETDLEKLVKLCHKNGMRLILDFVPNHMSHTHPIFIDAQTDRKSKYRKWFVFKKWPDEYLCFLDVKELPKINVDEKEARRYVISAAKHWLEKFDIDGYRLDHAIGPSLNFLRELSKEVKNLKKDFVLIGEAGEAVGTYWKETFKKELIETLWIIKSLSMQEKERVENIMDKWDLDSCVEFNDILMKKLEEVLDACIDFSFRDLAWMFADGKINLEEFWNKLEKHRKNFGKSYLISFLSNHDCGRFLPLFGKEKTILLSSIQFLLEGPILVYYGEEIGLGGKGTFEEARRFMPWNRNLWDKELLKHFTTLCKLKLRK